DGVVITEDVINLFIVNSRFKLLLDKDHASFQAATEVAKGVNDETRYETENQSVATALGPGVVEVRIPSQYRNDEMRFIAQVLDVTVENPHSQARVVVNAKAGTVIVSGEVEISPVVINHRNLTVTIGGAGEEAVDGEPKPGE